MLVSKIVETARQKKLTAWTDDGKGDEEIYIYIYFATLMIAIKIELVNLITTANSNNSPPGYLYD